MKRLAVYCGARDGSLPAYTDSARALGSAMAVRQIDLVYGGGKLGLMGVVADAVLAGGGKAYGVIPTMLKDFEVAHPGLTELHEVSTMHERKARMTDLTDAFVAMPGGIGTLDELFEAWTWCTLGYHSKPFALFNVAGYWDRLIEFLDHVAHQQFMSQERRNLLIVESEIEPLLDRLTAACARQDGTITW